MKRLGMVIGLWMLTSGTSLWAQSVTVTSARQQAEEAAARVRVEEAKAAAARQVSPNTTQSVTATSARQQAEEAAARARVEEKAAAARQVSPNTILDLQRSLNLVSPLGQSLMSGSVQWNSPRSNDPLVALQVAPGTWWNNSDTATRLSLSKEQQKKMDDIFQQFRLTLIDLNASLSKEELILDPLIAAERLDEVKILTQIDRIAQARAELEKANSRMLLGIRQSLTMEQWTKIQASPKTFRIIAPR